MWLFLRLTNTGLVPSRVNLTLCGEGDFLALVCHGASNVVTKTPSGVNVLTHWVALHHIFSYQVV